MKELRQRPVEMWQDQPGCSYISSQRLILPDFIILHMKYALELQIISRDKRLGLVLGDEPCTLV